MFGRRIQFDERNRGYALTSGKIKSYTWRCNAALNQRSEGSCVGFAVTHELAARPAEAVVSDALARQIYLDAQKIDPWPGGAYPGASPRYEGTSVLAGVKVAHRLGWFESYYWAFTTESLLYTLGRRGPCVLGVNWHEGMYTPDKDGFIRPTGKILGGHAVLVNAISVKNNRVTIHNSWGRNWGINGECYLSFEDLDKLLRQRGEAVFFQKRKSKI